MSACNASTAAASALANTLRSMPLSDPILSS